MTRQQRAARFGWTALVVALLAAPVAADEIEKALTTLRAVDREGKSNDAAGPAWKALVGEGSAALFPTLAAIDDT